MKRYSRFENLEHERTSEGSGDSAPAASPTGAALERFEAPPPPSLEAAAPPPTTDEVPRLALRLCPTCGTTAGQLDRFCASCGTSLDAVPAPAPASASATLTKPAAAAEPSPGLREAMELMVQEQNERHRRAELWRKSLLVARGIAVLFLGLLFVFGKKGHVPWPFGCLTIAAVLVLIPAAAWRLRTRGWWDFFD